MAKKKLKKNAGEPKTTGAVRRSRSQIAKIVRPQGAPRRKSVFDPQALCGWVNNPVEARQVAMTSPNWFPAFGAAAPEVMSAVDFPDTFLWEAEEKIFGRTLPAYHQVLGTCVSQGWGRFIQDQLLINIAFRGAVERFVAPVATEPLYVGARIEVGQMRLGSAQGCIGSWMAEFVRRWGFLLRMPYGRFDFTRPNDNWAQQMGSQRAGLPPELEDVARKHPVKSISPVRNALECRAAVCAQYGVPICSNVGFTNQRDAEGFDRPSGTWNHCMYVRGYFLARRRRKAFVIQQSWGNQPGGPNRIYCESGRVVTLPEGCFAVDWEVLDTICAQNESYTGADALGFKLRRMRGGLLA